MYDLNEQEIINNIYNIDINYLLKTKNISYELLYRLAKYTSIKTIVKTQKITNTDFLTKLINHPHNNVEESYLNIEDLLECTT